MSIIKIRVLILLIQAILFAILIVSGDLWLAIPFVLISVVFIALQKYN